jgi:hypothetical protein
MEYWCSADPYIGLLGAITGIFFFMTSSLSTGSDPNHVKEVISDSLTGIGIAFIPTITGVFFRIILSWEHYMVTHEVESALNGFIAPRYERTQLAKAAVAHPNLNSNGLFLRQKPNSAQKRPVPRSGRS